ncbi:hypothetical protein ACFPM3_01690 [Streptomyces coeruleoprunus]|uniref:Secreted protein n=1 Tax=Streptomyces coeruleoprunus TaxID=285563 RepID=A0ABV9X716_9ACTN
MKLSKQTLLTAALTGALVAPLATGASASASSGTAEARAAVAAPGFLAPRDLPPATGTVWSAGKVTKGLPDVRVFCLDKVLPGKGATWHRQFGTDLDTWAVQVSVTAPSASAAAKLAADAEKAAANCAADWLRRTPGGTASWQDYGKLKVEEGAHVYGVHTGVPDSEHGVHLFGIGRDGRTVTVVKWAQMGTLEHAPVAAFKKTTVTAVNKLH